MYLITASTDVHVLSPILEEILEKATLVLKVLTLQGYLTVHCSCSTIVDDSNRPMPCLNCGKHFHVSCAGYTVHASYETNFTVICAKQPNPPPQKKKKGQKLSTDQRLFLSRRVLTKSILLSKPIHNC